MLGAIILPQVNATSSDGRCAPYCLTSFFELLHSTIDSYDADFIVGFFLPPVYLRLPFRGQLPNLEEKMSMLLALQRLNTGSPIRCLPIRRRYPILSHVRSRCRIRRRMKNRLNCRIVSADLRGYPPSDCNHCHESIL